MTITHEVRTGIAGEAVVYPGVVAALLQDGTLVVVDPDSGRIRSRRRVGYSSCAPQPFTRLGHGIVVNALNGPAPRWSSSTPAGRSTPASASFDPRRWRPRR
jgi:hypothetical protein